MSFAPAEGKWCVGELEFTNKFQALLYATNTNRDIKFVYFDEIWNTFDRSLLGKISLNELYRQRAQQLRDSYDYLILYFSGGADSYNVLRSFIDNNIHLDEICVKWPMITIKSQLYKPNNIDTSSFNYLSEWDYAIKPVLDKISKTNPNIKIMISDWSEKLSYNSYGLDSFQKINNWNDIEIPYSLAYSKNEQILLDKGKTVCSIYGIDKPIISFKDDKWFMNFTDLCTGIGIPSDENPEGTEYFYWSHKLPILAFEQAYQLATYLDAHLEVREFFNFLDSENWSEDYWKISGKIRDKIIIDVVYDNWNRNFQASKPIIPDRADKQSWIFSYPEMRNIRDCFLDTNSLFLSQLDKKFIVEVKGTHGNKIRGRYIQCRSKWHFVKHVDIKN